GGGGGPASTATAASAGGGAGGASIGSGGAGAGTTIFGGCELHAAIRARTTRRRMGASYDIDVRPSSIQANSRHPSARHPSRIAGTGAAVGKAHETPISGPSHRCLRGPRLVRQCEPRQ